MPVSTRPAAFPDRGGSVRIFFIRSSGLNFFPFTMPMAANCPRVRIVRIGRLLLNVGVDHLEERVVAWRNCIERFPAGLDELGRGNWRVASSLTLPSGRRDARADASRRVGINLERFLDHFDRRLRIVVREEGASGITTRVVFDRAT